MLQCVLDWGKCGVHVEAPKGKKENTSHRNVPTFIYDACNGPFILKVAREVERLGLERKVVKKCAFLKHVPYA